MGLLDDLKKQAGELKAQDIDRVEALRSNAQAVDRALRRTFLYLHDLARQLNVVKLPSPFVYKLPKVDDISGLVFQDFFADFRTKHFIDKDYCGEVHLAARCFSDKVLSVRKGPEEMERFRDTLWQHNIEHASVQFRDPRRVITHEVFEVECDFRLQAKFEGNHETGRVKVTCKNVGDFNIDLFQLTAQELDDRAIEEFAKYFIGRPSEWADIVKHSVLNRKPAAPARKPGSALPAARKES